MMGFVGVWKVYHPVLVLYVYVLTDLIIILKNAFHEPFIYGIVVLLRIIHSLNPERPITCNAWSIAIERKVKGLKLFHYMPRKIRATKALHYTRVPHEDLVDTHFSAAFPFFVRYVGVL
jgi:hypothetical protein